MEKEPIVQKYEDDVVEIDLLQILNALKKKILWILLAAVLGGGLLGAFSYYVLIPKYTSTAMMYVLSKETTLTSLADLQIGSQLTQDYQVIVTSRPVINDVISQLGLDEDYEDFLKRLEIENPADTRILSISAEDPDPEMAKKIVDAVAMTSSDYIGDIMEMVPPKLIETGEVPQEKSSPNCLLFTVIGVLAGALFVCGIVSVRVIFDDTVKNEDDVARYLQISVLASVPDRKGEVAEDKEAMAKNGPSARSKKGKEGRDADRGRSRKKRRKDTGWTAER